MNDVERRCELGKRCRATEVKDGKRLPALLSTEAGFCEACVRWIRTVLRQLGNDWCKLKLSLGEKQAGGADKIRFTRTPGIPINVETDALMGEVIDAAALAAKAVQRHLGVGRDEKHTSDYLKLLDDVAYVEPRLEHLIAAGPRSFVVWADGGYAHAEAELSGIDVCRRLVDAHEKVRRHLGESVKVRKEPLPCPRCNTPRALVREVQDRRGRVSASDGSATPEVVRCLACAEEWSESDYRWLSRLVSGEKEGKKMLELAQWLIAEARWQRDAAAWLTAEREWALADIAHTMGIDGTAALLDQVRRAVTA